MAIQTKAAKGPIHCNLIHWCLKGSIIVKDSNEITQALSIVVVAREV